MAYNLTFSPDAWADYLYWQSEDKKTVKRINKLLQELQRDGAVPVSYTHLDVYKRQVRYRVLERQNCYERLKA